MCRVGKWLRIQKSGQGTQASASPRHDVETTSQQGDNRDNELHPKAGTPTNTAPGIVPESATKVPESMKSTDDQIDLPDVGDRYARAALTAAARKLKEKLPEQEQEKFHVDPIAGSADITALSQRIEAAIVHVMDREEIEGEGNTLVKAVTNGWVKNALPYVQKSLSVAKVDLRKVPTHH
jgi:hypothetical protein